MTYQERPSGHFSFREKCMQEIKTFLSSYKTATDKSIKIENLQKVRQSNVHKRLTDSDEEGVCIKWTGNHKEILVVTGLKAEVDSAVTEILQLIDIINATMDLKKEEIRWLSRCGYIDKIRRDGNFVGIQCNEDSKQIVFSGNERQVVNARLALTTHLPCLSSDKVDYLTPSINNFLLKERNKDKVLSKLTMSFQKKCLKAIVAVQGKVACLWTHEDHLQEAKALMKDVFSEKSVSLSPEGYQDVTKLSAWSDLKTTEEKDGLVQIDVKGSNVHIVGFKSKATEAHTKIASFLDENCMREELFETEYGIAKFIVEKDSNFDAFCKANYVQYSMKHGLKNGVLLQGKKKNLQRAMSNLVKRKANTKRKACKLEKFMIGNYLKSEKGKTTVNQVEQDNECIILVGNDGYPHEQTVEQADECKEEDLQQARNYTEPHLGRSLWSAVPRERFNFTKSHLGGASGSAVPTRSISVSVHHGNIVEETNEVIVNSTDSKFDMLQEWNIKKAGRVKSKVRPKQPRENFILLYLYAQERDKLERAMKMIETEVNKAYLDHSIHVTNYDQLTDLELSKIEEIGDENNVQLTKKRDQKEIVVTGLMSDVMEASKIISEVLSYNNKRSNQQVQGLTEVLMDLPVVIPDYDQLTPWELSKIEEIAAKNNIKLTTKKEQKEFVLTGTQSKVIQASKIITAKVNTFSKAKAVKSHAHFNWQYKDSNKAWVDFPSTSNTALEVSCKDTTGSQMVELSLDFEEKEQECKVDFKSMEMSFGIRKLEIRRDVKTELPRHWQDMKGKDHIVVSLYSTLDEYVNVEKNMRMTLPRCQILSIARIQNKKQYIHYSNQKKLLEKSVSNNILERQLFHGTKAETSQKIIERGFNRSYRGVNGTAYGNGVYFAKNAQYSSVNQYSTPDKDGVKTMLLADVITGDYCQGKSGLKTLDQKPGTTHSFESAVDNVNNPSIFVVFEDASAYPAYIIKYKL